MREEGLDLFRELDFFTKITGNIAILGHHNADPDALGAAQGVKELIEKTQPDHHVEIVFPEDISSLSKKIADSLRLDFKDEPSEDPDTLIIVDTGKLSQLGKWEAEIKKGEHKIITIDHHLLNQEIQKLSCYYLNKPEAHSTSEIIYGLFEKKKLKPTPKTAKALLAGIMFDSKFFNLGNAQMFQTVARLLEITGQISEIHGLMKKPIDVSEKIARLKGAQRLQIEQINKWIIVTSQLSSHQASGARGIIKLGADVAIVVGQKKDKIRASLRSTTDFYKTTKIHLGYVASELEETFSGSGSGHPTAAGFNGAGTIEEFNSKSLNLIRNRLS